MSAASAPKNNTARPSKITGVRALDFRLGRSIRRARTGFGQQKLSDQDAPASLLNRTGDGREYIVGVGSDKPDRAYNDHEDHCQHYGIFRDILSHEDEVGMGFHGLMKTFFYGIDESQVVSHES